MAKIKEQIMLNGGFITSMAMSAGAFTNFVANKTAANAVFAVAEDLRSTAVAVVAMHAVFCDGWWDNPRNVNDGYWICKNRWGSTSSHAAWHVQRNHTTGCNFALMHGPYFEKRSRRCSGSGCMYITYAAKGHPLIYNTVSCNPQCAPHAVDGWLGEDNAELTAFLDALHL
jgi:hypothetical protein